MEKEENPESNSGNTIQLINEIQSGLNPPDNLQQLSSVRLNSKNGDNSPESGSLYSDEIPSGYNSGEQYDTLSTGYMSGEAYELPETRMDLREPTLGNVAEEEIELELPPSSSRLSSSDSENERDDNPEAENNPKSPSGNKLFSLMRPGKGLMKAPPTFPIPLIETPMLEVNENPYKSVPSDTDDTSAFESDANRGAALEEGCLSGDGGMTTSDSGAELLGDFKRRFGRRSRRYGGPNSCHSSSPSGHKRIERDEEWFMHNDTKYWSMARGICFWGSIGFILTCIVAAGIVIAQMPKTCDPKISWYQGAVSAELNFSDDFYEVLSSGIDKFKEHGVKSILLREKDSSNLSTTNFMKNVIPDFFVNKSLALEFTQKLHDHDMNLIVEIPIVGEQNLDKEYWDHNTLSLELQHTVANCIKFWATRGSDGILLRGLNHFIGDKWIGDAISDWRTVMVKYGSSSNKQILIAEVEFAIKTVNANLITKMDLLDATLHIPTNHFEIMSSLDKIFNMTSWDTSLEYPWINWNLNAIRPLSKAVLALQMMLPGTINVQREDIESRGKLFKELASLRQDSVPIYMNGNYRRCDCQESYEKEMNFQFTLHPGGLLQLERFYNRRNRFVYVGNFGNNGSVLLDSIGKMYSGGYVQIQTGNNGFDDDADGLGTQNSTTSRYAEFKDIALDPGEALVMKLPK